MGPLTQVAEYRPFKPRVVGSSPARPTGDNQRVDASVAYVVERGAENAQERIRTPSEALTELSHSEVAQLVECPAVNRKVVGSKPTLAAFHP
jgi:hypothetical protein